MHVKPPSTHESAAARLVHDRAPLYAQRSAVRLSDREIDRDLTVDDYAGHLLLTDYGSGLSRDFLRSVAAAFADALGQIGRTVNSASVKARPDDLAHRGVRQTSAPKLLLGDPPPDRFAVAEDDLLLGVSFVDAGFATGLFLDMVEGRRLVRRLAGEHGQVLNLFSYTGAFSIAAAKGGAQQVIEVDTSRKWLGWSQNNQRLNDVMGHGIVRQRCEDAVRLLGKQPDASFDLVISDPPSYANPKRGKRFTVEAGYRQMAGDFERVVRPGGRLLACCNHAGTGRGQVLSWLPKAFKLEQWVHAPPDFANADYLKVALLRRK